MKLELFLSKKDSEFKESWRIYNESFGRKRTFAEFRSRFCHEGNKIFIVLINKNKVGCIMITTRNELGYFILPKYQKKGIGKKAIKQLMIKEKRKYYWAIVDFDNEKSKKFTQSLGMIPNGLVYSIDIQK
jgi:predicted acetyltransferase